MSGETMTKPESMTDEHVGFLNALRDSASINMFGAPQVLAREFGLDRYEAREIVMYWMKNPEPKND